MRYALFGYVCGDCLRFCQRSDPVVVIEHFCCGVFFFLQEHKLFVESEATLFWSISNGPLDCEDVKDSEEALALSSACKGNDGMMFLSLARGTWGIDGCQFEM